MTNEQKAKQLCREFENAEICGSPLSRGSVAFQASMEMAEWKEQQMIEKFMKFLHAECYDARLLHWKDEIISQKIEKAVKEE